jgi:hypothetical protein
MTDSSFRAERRRRFSHSESSADIIPRSADEVASPATAPPSDDSLTDGGAPGPWKPIDAFALSGAQVFVRSAEGEVAEARYFSTRRFNPGRMKWEPFKRWKLTTSVGVNLPWQPVQYRVIDPGID